MRQAFSIWGTEMKRYLIAVGLVLAALFNCAFADGGWLEIYLVNVGQGDATLIVGPQGKTVLVDAGKSSSAAQNILNLINELGIASLDYTISTHYDQDHIGAFCDLFSSIGQPDVAAYDRGGDRRSSGSSAQPAFFVDYMNCAGAKRTRLEPGSFIDLGDGAAMYVLAVGDADYMDGRGTSDYTVLYDESSIECANHENEKSIALLVTYGGFDFLLSGDLTGIDDPPINCDKDSVNVEVPVGSLIVGSMFNRGVDVFHLDHHGSESTGNTSDYVALIAPEVAVISVGDSASCGAGFNAYGHPGQLALDALWLSGVVKIYQTEEGGCMWVNDPVPCTPAPGETCPRDYHDIAHEFLYDQHVRIRTDGQKYEIKNLVGEWDSYSVDDPYDDDSDDDADDDDTSDDDVDDDTSDDDSGDDDGCGC